MWLTVLLVSLSLSSNTHHCNIICPSALDMIGKHDGIAVTVPQKSLRISLSMQFNLVLNLQHKLSYPWPAVEGFTKRQEETYKFTFGRRKKCTFGISIHS